MSVKICEICDEQGSDQVGAKDCDGGLLLGANCVPKGEYVNAGLSPGQSPRFGCLRVKDGIIAPLAWPS
jgi:hypothetical protein